MRGAGLRAGRGEESQAAGKCVGAQAGRRLHNPRMRAPARHLAACCARTSRGVDEAAPSKEHDAEGHSPGLRLNGALERVVAWQGIACWSPGEAKRDSGEGCPLDSKRKRDLRAGPWPDANRQQTRAHRCTPLPHRAGPGRARVRPAHAREAGPPAARAQASPLTPQAAAAAHLGQQQGRRARWRAAAGRPLGTRWGPMWAKVAGAGTTRRGTCRAGRRRP
jgi:hypothetical protein